MGDEMKQVVIFGLLLTGVTLIFGAWYTLYQLWFWFSWITGV